MSKLAVLFCAFLAVSYVQAGPAKEPVDLSHEALQEKIINLQRIVVKNVADAKEKAADALEEIREKTSTISQSAYEETSEALKKLDKQFDEYKKPAGSKNINDCIELQDDVHNEGLSIIALMSYCITIKVDEGYKYNSALNKYADQAQTAVHNIKAKAEECQKSAAPGCHYQVNQEFEVASRQVAELLENVAKEEKLVETLIPTVDSCSMTNTIEVFVSNTQGVLELFKQCVAKHLEKN